MWTQLKVFICLLLLYWMTLVQAVTIRDDVETTTNINVKSSTYRLSLAQAQTASHHRVPSHLQKVRNAFVYEDADDVIHVIEPPKHFQELKKLMQNRQKPEGWDQISKPRIARPVARLTPRKQPQNIHTTQKPVDRDLETQDTEHLPVEILASVRKTENFLKKHKPKLPLAQQRVKTKKIQTVIWEKAQEHQQYERGQEKKIHGLREYHNNNRRKFIKRRIKRQVPLSSYQPLKGVDLLEHINELVKNASIYLDSQQTYDYSDFALTEEQQKPSLQGKSLTRTSDEPTHRPPQKQLSEEDVIKILENSLKVTDIIVEQIKQHSNFTQTPRKCEYSRGTRTNHIKSLRQHIQCMQNLIKTMNATRSHKEQPCSSTTTTPNTNNSKRFGERLDARETKDLRQKPFLVAAIGDDYFDEDSSPAALNTTLIYDDVMTTIRNLLQASNLQNLEDSTSSSSSKATTSSESLTAWDEITLPRDNSQQPVDFHNLNQYLNSLQTIVANLPQPSNASTLNLHEIEGQPSKYYFINPQGGIYHLPQPFRFKDQRPSPPSTIFRQFPDIPSISEYLGANGSLLTASQNVIEIL